MPGNSCSLARASRNLCQMRERMNPRLLQSACVSAQQRCCAVVGLSEILRHYEQLGNRDIERATSPRSSSSSSGSSIGGKRSYVDIQDNNISSINYSTTSSNSSNSSSNHNNANSSSNSSSSTTKLPSLRIALLKIDVEGEEISVLRSLYMKQHWAIIHRIIVECHPDNVNIVKQYLEKHDFTIYNSNEDINMGRVNVDSTGNTLIFAVNSCFYNN